MKNIKLKIYVALMLIVMAVGIADIIIPSSSTAEAAISSISDLNDMSHHKKHRESHKAMVGPSNNSETDILNIESGNGVINYLWLADRPGSGGGFPQFDHSIRIYTNGSNTPDVDIDLGLFFGYAYGEVMPANNISTAHWHARVGGPINVDRTGGGTRLPIPFHGGIRIAVANINNTPISAIFSQVDYSLESENSGMSVPPYTLKVVGNKWLGNRQSLNHQSDVTLANIPEGNPGVIVGHSMATGGATNYSYLERPLSLYIDGEPTPSIKSSGTEDWFSGSDYYFTGQTPYSSHGAMGFGVTSDFAYGSTALVDFLALNGGYAFESSAKLKWEHHPAATSNSTYGSALFYYRQN